jgi:hypothetical protein
MSPAVSPDELELFYSTTDGVVAHIRRSVRASKGDVFPEGPPVPELDAACTDVASDRHMDLSADGLRAYIVCVTEPTVTSGPLRVARRSSTGSPFMLDTTTYGTVGPSVSIAKDELVAYSTTLTRPGPPLMFTRNDTSSPFATGTSIPGLEDVDLSTIEPSPDGLSLYGNLDQAIQIATRATPSGPYGATTIAVAPAMDHVIGAPELSRDCRSLYYVDVDRIPTPDVYSIRVLTR